MIHPGPIEKGIPIPPFRRGRHPGAGRAIAYKFDHMEVMDSFSFSVSADEAFTMRHRLLTAAQKFGLAHNTRYTTRIIFVGGDVLIRIWRVQ